VAIAAALLGLAISLALHGAPVGGRGVLAGTATAALLVAALAVPTATTAHLVRSGAGDSARAGTMPAAKLHALSAFLRRHQRGARYEVASASIVKVAPVIVRDARPVLVLAGDAGRQLVTPAQLRHEVRAGHVRYALIGTARCVPGHGYACTPVVRWVRSHARDVSLAAGFPHRGVVYRLGGPSARGGLQRHGPAHARGGRPARGGLPRRGPGLARPVHRPGAARPHGGRDRRPA
jgi:hypothetical protein